MRVFSDDHRAKLSAAARARRRSPADVAGLEAYRSANRNQISATQAEKWADPEYRERQKKALRGAKRSAECRPNISKAQQRKFADPEFRKKWSEARLAGIAKRKAERRLIGLPFHDKSRWSK